MRARQPAGLLRPIGNRYSQQGEGEKGQGCGNQDKRLPSPIGVQEKPDQEDGQAELELADEEGKMGPGAGETPAQPPEDGGA